MKGLLRWRCPRGDRGAAAVEFALVWFFVLGPVIYGLIAFGFVMSDQITASQMAREIARSYAICANQPNATQSSCSTAAQTQFNNTEIASWKQRSATVTPDSAANCFVTGSAVQSVTVAVTPVLPVPFVTQVQGKATTPCGG